MSSEATSLNEWLTPAEFDAFVGDGGSGIIFKHSTRCAVSSWSHAEVTRFAAERSDVPIYLVLVVENRPLSQHIAGALGVAHASPQAILVRDGKPVWNVSHGEVTAEALADAWKSA